MNVQYLGIVMVVIYVGLTAWMFVLEYASAGYKITRAMRIAGVCDGAWMWANDIRVLSGVRRAAFYSAMNDLEERGLVARRVADPSTYYWPPRGAAEFTLTEKGLDAASAA